MKILLNVLVVIVGALIIMKAFFWIVEKTQESNNESPKTESLIKEVKIKDLVVSEQG